MIKQILLAVAAITLAAIATPTHAASVSLDPSSAQVSPGGMFTVNLVLNAADTAGDHPGAFCGEIVIDYDPNLIMFTGFTASNSVDITTDPFVGTDNGLETVTLAFNDAPDVGVLGTYSFKFNGGANETADIGIADTGDLFSTFANHLPTNQPFVPDFIGTSVFAVPVPAVAWLMASGLGVFGFFVKRRH